MNGLFGRRNFFGALRKAATIGGVMSQAQWLRAAPAAAQRGEDYYEKLGVTKIINAAGTYTNLTASIMPDSVQAAVARAAETPVRLQELQKAAGEYLARKLNCEAALVSAGAASALTLGAAGCLTVANHCGIRAIPVEVAHLKNEVLVQKGHRYGYDQALICCGVRMVEVETLAEYEAAFNERTVMAHFYNAAEHGQISREDWIRVAHAHGVPCFNDAAADVPPIANLWNYTRMGFDLVTFSGGKGIRGPQNAGLLLGRKDLIAAAAASNNPFDGRRPWHEGRQGADRRHGGGGGLAPQPIGRRLGEGIPAARRTDRDPSQGTSQSRDGYCHPSRGESCTAPSYPLQPGKTEDFAT